jgi:serpin B
LHSSGYKIYDYITGSAFHRRAELLAWIPKWILTSFFWHSHFRIFLYGSQTQNDMEEAKMNAQRGSVIWDLNKNFFLFILTRALRAIGALILALLPSVPCIHAEDSLNFSLNGGGAAQSSTPGVSEIIAVGYAALAVNSEAAPYGTAVFSCKSNGITISEAGVPSSPPTTKARIFIDYRLGVDAVPALPGAGKIDVNTGFALVNQGSGKATLHYVLRDRTGQPIAAGDGSIAAGHHIAKFINQLGDIATDFTWPADFANTTQFASLEIASDRPLSVLALRLTTNQRKEALYTTIPIADLTRSLSADPLYFAHFADGGGYTSSLILLNTSEATETGTLQILDNNGQPMVVTSAGGTATSSFPYSIPAGGVFHFRTDGSPSNAATGWVRLIPDAGTSAPVGAGLFGYNPVDVLVSESGVPAAAATSHAHVFVDRFGNHNTGLAIANTGSAEVNIQIRAFLKDGITAAGAVPSPIQLRGNGHVARFADQLVAGLPEGFTGVLDISSAAPFAALTIRSLDNERHDFLMATFPVADATRAAPVPILFPQIADGDGYATEFFLLSPAGASESTLSYFDNAGLPLTLGNFQVERVAAGERNVSPVYAENDLSQLVRDNNTFAVDLYRAIKDPSQNLLFSPYSLSTALAMTYAGARNQTEAQMATALHFTFPQNELHPLFNALGIELGSRKQSVSSGDSKYLKLNVANALWGQKNFSFLDDFLSVLMANYGAGMWLVDFESNAAQACLAIDDWVARQTENKIRDLLSPEDVDSLTRLVLTNTVYFKASWAIPFNQDATYNGNFNLLDNSVVTVPMMIPKASKGENHEVYTAAVGSGYQAVELPYYGNDFSMLVILPDQGTFAAFEQSLNYPLISQIVNNLAVRDVQLRMPKFGYVSKFDVSNALAGLGMTDAFDPGTADFSGMDGFRDLFISKAIHQAFISVDENGTEAAAATAIVMSYTSIHDPLQVTVNRPFIYLIRDKQTGAILFLGRVINPNLQ